jgi:hypothetical protein
VERGLRIVRATLHGQIAAAAEPIECFVREDRQIDERCGHVVADAEPSVAVFLQEQAAPEADGDREVRGRRPDRFSGVVRCGLHVHRLDRADAAARGERGDRHRPAVQQRLKIGTAIRRHVERRVHEPALRRRCDPGLMPSRV